MKKFFKILCINLILIIILFFILDFLACTIIVTHENSKIITGAKHSRTKIFVDKYKFKKNDDFYFVYNSEFRPTENINSKKGAIVIFGCSFAYGMYLNADETFSYRLGKMTLRPIYNRAMHGWAPKQMIYQLQNEKFYTIVPKPEYVIYVFIPEQVSRQYINTKLVSSQPRHNLFYKNKNGVLKRDKFTEYMFSSSLFYILKRQKYPRLMKMYEQKDLELLKLYFLTAQKEIIRHWGNDVKFVIFLYGKENDLQKLKSVFSSLKKSNFIIVDINGLSSKNFFTPKYQIGKSLSSKRYDRHPNAKAWEELTPLIVKKLGL